MTPPAATAATTASEVQLAGVPSPITRSASWCPPARLGRDGRAAVRIPGRRQRRRRVVVAAWPAGRGHRVHRDGCGGPHPGQTHQYGGRHRPQYGQ